MKNWGIILIGSLLTTQSMGQLKTISPIAGKIIDSNPALKACINIPQPPTPDNPIPADASDPNYATYYGCVATPPVPTQVDRDHWTSRLLDANGNERTGTYRKNGQWCAGQGSIPTADCPIEVLAYFSINCGSTTDPTTRSVTWSDGTTHCPMLDNFSVNHVTRMAVAAPGLPVLKEIKIGPQGWGGDTIPVVVIPKGPFLQELIKTYKCPNDTDTVSGQDQYGYPTCSSVIEKQITTDENTEKADVATLQKCIGETADVMAGKMECTTACTPQHCKYKLFNAKHTADACKANGTLALVSDGSAVNEATSSNTTFCRMTGDHCSSGWTPMTDAATGNAWTTTSDGKNYKKHDNQQKDYCQTTVHSDSLGPLSCNCSAQTDLNQNTSHSGEHVFASTAVEYKYYYQIRAHSSYQCCDSLDNRYEPFDQNPGSVDQFLCGAIVTEVGCY